MPDTVLGIKDLVSGDKARHGMGLRTMMKKNIYKEGRHWFSIGGNLPPSPQEDICQGHNFGGRLLLAYSG